MGDTFPMNKLPVSPEQRLEFAKRLVEGIRTPPQLPKDFDPLHATPEELIQYGLPPQPDKTKAPKQAASWERLMSKLPKFKFVQPKFKILEDHQSSSSTSTEVKAAPEADTHITTRTPNWAGAVLNATSNENFKNIMADWLVPNPYPGSDVDGTYHSSAWIGIDGWTSSDVLQGGTSQDVTLKSGELTRDIYAWCKWYPALPIRIDNVSVSAGDTVNCFIWATSKRTSKKTAYFNIFNWGTWEWSSICLTAPKDTELQGDSAEWIMEDSSYFGKCGMSDFGSIMFRSCWAGKDLVDENLANAELLQLQQADTTCVAKVEEPNTVLTVYYE
jgi:hypothetical protein